MTDYNTVNYISQTGSVSYHSYSHTTNITSSAATWATELNTIQRNMKEFAKVPVVKGSRAPYLQANNDYLLQLRSMAGVRYDSSYVYGWNFVNPEQANNYWPFTLDFGVPDQMMCLYFASCPTQPHPKLWEFPLVAFGSADCIMDYNVYNSALMTQMQTSFNTSYYYNKVPRGYYIHWRYLTNNGDFDSLQVLRANFLTDFFYWMVTTYPDIIFTTEDRVIDWIKNPTTTTVTKTLAAFKCAPKTIDPSRSCQTGAALSCDYSDSSFVKVCSKKCPGSFPGLGVNWNYAPNNFDTGHWMGALSYTIDDSWPSGYCASLYLTHTGTVPVQSWILTSTVLSTQATFTAFWGYIQKPVLVDPKAGVYRQKGFTDPIPSNVNYYLGGWCMQTQTGMFTGQTWVDANVRFGIDLYASVLQCPLQNCAVFCGNGLCEATLGENQTTCQIDCKKLLCPNRRVLWGRRF